jgi:hypothetical protein
LQPGELIKLLPGYSLDFFGQQTDKAIASNEKFVHALENDSACIPMIIGPNKTVTTANKKPSTARPIKPLITFCMTSPLCQISE